MGTENRKFLVRPRWQSATFLTVAVLLLLGFVLPLAAQPLSDYRGSENYQYINIHSGNKVRTTFYNYGLVGNVGAISGEWPIGTGNEYIGDVTPLVGVEFVHPSGDTIRSVITCLSPRQSPEYGNDGKFGGFMPLMGFAAPPPPDEQGAVAMSNMPETWPSFWPDKMLTDPRDQLWRRDDVSPGWRNSWNGYFGRNVFNADQESYFYMDDNQDREFLEQTVGDTTYTYYPTSANLERGGLGIRVGVRGFQWAHFLAEDVIFWHYEITNISDNDYDKVVFGMVVGTLSGGRGDSDDDLASFDPENDITYSYDSDDQGTAGWIPVRPGGPNVGYVGYAFLESPGNAYDGIDNDGDSENITSPTLTQSNLNDMVNVGLNYPVGSELVLIDYDLFADTAYYRDPMRGRSVVTMTSGGYETTIRGESVTILPTVSYRETAGNGIDDNYNGLIDERLVDPAEGVDSRLDHVGLKYKNFLTGAGVNDLMIDEARDDGIDNDGDWDFSTDDVGFDGTNGTSDLGEGDGIPTYGEPNFDRTDIDESDQIGLTSFDYFSPPGNLRMNDDNALWNRMSPGVVDVVSNEPEDGDFVYGSGYFPLPSGRTERFSMALMYGEDLVDITNNKLTVQQIYNNNYTFVKPPPKPTVQAVPGDGKVTLYWDSEAETAFDQSMPTGSEEDFEGYKIYRATDPGFLENFVITDGQGRRVFHKPIAQFDLENGNSGYFPEAAFGVSFYLGDDTGLQHVWTDSTVENGQTYFYAVTAYDRGYSGFVDSSAVTFFPAETPKVITVDRDGEVNLDINTVQVTPGVKAAGYEGPEISLANHVSGGSTGIIFSEPVDDRLIEDNRNYEITFSPINEEQVSDTAFISYAGADTAFQTISLGDLGDERRVLDQFNPYFRDQFNDPFFETWTRFGTQEAEVFDGQRVYFIVPKFPGRQIHEISGYQHGDVPTDSLMNYSFSIVNYSTARISGKEYYRDYLVTFHDPDGPPVDQGIELRGFAGFRIPPVPVYFRVKDLVTNEYKLVAIDERSSAAIPNGRPDAQAEAILIFETETTDTETDTVPTWAIQFSASLQGGNVKPPAEGDSLIIRMYKPYTDLDRYTFDTQSARVDRDQINLNKIKVYPNPYLAASPQEPSNNYTSGRGEREITFIHLPESCTIRIYNVRGELVRKLEHNGGLHDGSISWDLRSKDGLDVAYGIYVYHVDSDYGEHVGKFAVIK